MKFARLSAGGRWIRTFGSLTGSLSVKLCRHAAAIVGVVGGAVSARRPRSGEVPQRRHTCGPAAAPGLPQVRANECLWAMLERLLDRNHDHRRRLLAIDSKTSPEAGIDADPGSAIDPIGLVRARDQKDQPD